MEVHPAKRFFITCLISLVIFGLIYFFYPNRNVQMATLILVAIAGSLTIVALIIFIVRMKQRKDDY